MGASVIMFRPSISIKSLSHSKDPKCLSPLHVLPSMHRQNTMMHFHGQPRLTEEDLACLRDVGSQIELDEITVTSARRAVHVALEKAGARVLCATPRRLDPMDGSAFTALLTKEIESSLVGSRGQSVETARQRIAAALDALKTWLVSHKAATGNPGSKPCRLKPLKPSVSPEAVTDLTGVLAAPSTPHA